MPRFVDLSIPIQNDLVADPPGMEPRIDYTDHKQSAPALAARFPGLRPEELIDGEGWAAETVSLSTHNGTHVDAPWHYHSTMDQGKPSASIDELPLDWFFGAGVKLDFRHFADGHVVRARDIEVELERIGHVLAPGDIVLVNTSAGKRLGEPDFYKAGCGMGREATLFLTSRGVRVVGTDAWSWDVYNSYAIEEFKKHRDVAVIWEGHKAGRDIGYSQIEKLANLEQLPATGYKVICFPVKIHRASAGWTRAVAMFDE